MSSLILSDKTLFVYLASCLDSLVRYVDVTKSMHDLSVVTIRGQHELRSEGEVTALLMVLRRS